MAAVATLGTYRKRSFQIYIFALLGVGAWMTYDGYLSPAFIQKHTKEGIADSDLTFNRTAPFVLVPLAVLVAGRWWMVKDKKVVADGKTLILENGTRIEYDSIEKIDKSQFEKKGHFYVTYNASGREQTVCLSDRMYDKLEDVLAELIGALKGTQA
jgi:hypothetical protein